MGPALESFLEGFRDCALTPTRRLIAAYLKGQLGPLPRKSVLPMARDAGIPPRTLQELLSLHRWDEERFRDLLQRRVAGRRKSGPSVGFLVDSYVPKKGTKTPGVERQRDGSGRSLNAVRLLHLGYAENGFTCALDGDLYLPAGWAGDLDRRRAAVIPDALRYRHAWEIALDLLDRAARNAVPVDTLVFPAAFADAPAFLAGLVERKLAFVTEPPKSGVKPPREARAVAAAPGLTLLTTATEASPTALLDLWRSRERLARRLDDLKIEVGHDHFEVRSWRSLRRHLVLSSASLLFLSESREREAQAAPLRVAH
ncbi:MAG TPA: transposase [Planctomycetota bacterium]